MSDLGMVFINGKEINLNTTSLEELKNLMEKINEKEEVLKQELERVLEEQGKAQITRDFTESMEDGKDETWEEVKGKIER